MVNTRNVIKCQGNLTVGIILILLLSACNSNNEKEDDDSFLEVAQDFADSIIEHGRDEYGAKYSPMFASVLNRQTMKLEDPDNIPQIKGVRVKDRSLTGGNMIHDIDLFQLLYDLSIETGNDKYAAEADRAIQFFFTNCQSPATGLMAWGEHIFWDFHRDQAGYAPNFDFHEMKEWPFWDQCYELAPEQSWTFAINEWDHQIHDQETGDFSRHARYTEHETFSGFDFPRYAGQMIERWVEAYNRPENANRPRSKDLLSAIGVLFNRMVENTKLSKAGLLIAGRSPEGDHNSVVWLTSNLELARCLELAAPTMEPGLGHQMKEFALKQDWDFLKAPHKLDSVGGGFSVTLHAETGLPRTRSMNKPYSSTWSTGYGYGTHAGTANTSYGRYKSISKDHPEMAKTYKELILLAGNKYLESVPDTTKLLKPAEFSQVIELMLNCHELTGNIQYIERAIFIAKFGIDLFLNDGLPLPKVSNQHDHYESITGGPSFMFQILRLHVRLKETKEDL
ncbi:MAG: hypothetical protein JXQ96_20930 [Cyclobacteriaceae bacterium]